MNNEAVKTEEKKVVKKLVVKRVGSLLCAFAILAISMVACFADGAATGGTGSEAVSAVQTVFTNVTGTINISNIVAILGIVVGACVGLVLMWFGIRKVIKIIMGAFRKGKISV